MVILFYVAVCATQQWPLRHGAAFRGSRVFRVRELLEASQVQGVRHTLQTHTPTTHTNRQTERTGVATLGLKDATPRRLPSKSAPPAWPVNTNHIFLPQKATTATIHSLHSAISGQPPRSL